MTIPGRATAEGTSRFRARHANECHEDFYRRVGDLWFSSIGIGTYLGKWDRETDAAYTNAVETTVALGGNVIDTAANYRFQRSERAIGTALANLISNSGVERNELIICTKGGYLPFDEVPPGNVREYIEETFVRPGIAQFSDFVGGSHCMSPGYLQNQIDQSLKNLGLDCLDVYYLHNPESQLGAIPREEFASRLRAAFALFEQNIADGKIASYGVATWNGFRVAPDAKDYHSLEEMVTIARDVAGDGHGFRFIQLPYNWAMREAVIFENQTVAGPQMSAADAALELGVNVTVSCSILQGRLSQGMPDDAKVRLVPDGTDAQAAIQFVRSAPGITTALVGMSKVAHVDENLGLRHTAPVSAAAYDGLLTDGDLTLGRAGGGN